MKPGSSGPCAPRRIARRLLAKPVAYAVSAIAKQLRVLLFWPHGGDVAKWLRRRSAKPLSGGSIPPVASMVLLFLSPGRPSLPRLAQGLSFASVRSKFESRRLLDELFCMLTQ